MECVRWGVTYATVLPKLFIIIDGVMCPQAKVIHNPHQLGPKYPITYSSIYP